MRLELQAHNAQSLDLPSGDLSRSVLRSQLAVNLDQTLASVSAVHAVGCRLTPGCFTNAPERCSLLKPSVYSRATSRLADLQANSCLHPRVSIPGSGEPHLQLHAFTSMYPVATSSLVSPQTNNRTGTNNLTLSKHPSKQ